MSWSAWPLFILSLLLPLGPGTLPHPGKPITEAKRRVDAQGEKSRIEADGYLVSVFRARILRADNLGFSLEGAGFVESRGEATDSLVYHFSSGQYFWNRGNPISFLVSPF